MNFSVKQISVCVPFGNYGVYQQLHYLISEEIKNTSFFLNLTLFVFYFWEEVEKWEPIQSVDNMF